MDTVLFNRWTPFDLTYRQDSGRHPGNASIIAGILVIALQGRPYRRSLTMALTKYLAGRRNANLINQPTDHRNRAVADWVRARRIAAVSP